MKVGCRKERKRQRLGQVLDAYIVELQIGRGMSLENGRDLLDRLDRSRFERSLKRVIQQTLTACGLEEVSCDVRR